MKKATWMVIIVVSFLLMFLIGCLSGLLVRQIPGLIPAVQTAIVNIGGTATQLPPEIATEIPTEMPTELPTEVERQTATVELPASTPEKSTIVDPVETGISMEEQVQLLLADGTITSAEGEYVRLDDFNEKWAQRNWFQWWNTGYSPTDFVLRGEAEWRSDPGDNTPELNNSGCGVVFHTTDENHLYLAYIGMDGNAYLEIINGGYMDTISSRKYGDYSLNGNGSFILAVEDEWMTFYVNGERIIRQSARTLPSGDLALTLLSGTNKGFGTQCEMTDLELWIMKD